VDGSTSFEVRNWRTGELIFAGRGTLDDFDRQSAEHDPEDRWYHIDHVLEATTRDLPPAPDELPQSLAQVVGDWATDNMDDAREFLASYHE